MSETEASLMTSSLRVSPPSVEMRSLRVMRRFPAEEGSTGRLWYADCDGCSDSGRGQFWNVESHNETVLFEDC